MQRKSWMGGVEPAATAIAAIKAETMKTPVKDPNYYGQLLAAIAVAAGSTPPIQLLRCIGIHIKSGIFCLLLRWFTSIRREEAGGLCN